MSQTDDDHARDMKLDGRYRDAESLLWVAGRLIGQSDELWLKHLDPVIKELAGRRAQAVRRWD